MISEFEILKHLQNEMPHIMEKVENLFGEKDESWGFSGIRICSDEDVPCVYYPRVEGKNIGILISKSCIDDSDCIRAEWQLAHECVHLLSPDKNKGINANFLEEGMATYFQDKYISDKYRREFNYKEKYKKAKELYSEIHNINPHIIKKIRTEKCPNLKEMTKEILLEYCKGLKDDTAEALIQSFYNEQ
ncbi:MAG: hypothetical protein OXU73_00940 [Candidatus Campbellbacteria bacterium]|nr:hypothetical protein [Candidatus Campbellbacteria bacterium]